MENINKINKYYERIIAEKINELNDIIKNNGFNSDTHTELRLFSRDLNHLLAFKCFSELWGNDEDL